MEQNLSWDAMNSSTIKKKLLTFNGTQKSITFFTTARVLIDSGIRWMEEQGKERAD